MNEFFNMKTINKEIDLNEAFLMKYFWCQFYLGFNDKFVDRKDK
jgi:hypothetical protein